MSEIVGTGSPPAPSRVRMVRPQFYRSQVTGGLAPDVRDLLIGLTTVADDEGWLLWRTGELAATIYPYAPAKARLRDMERRSRVLIDRGLVIVEPCGCAFLPTLKEHHGVKSGRQTAGIWGWHMGHATRQGMPRNSEECSSSSSGSSSSSVLVSVSGEGGPGGTVETNGAEPCAICHGPQDGTGKLVEIGGRWVFAHPRCLATPVGGHLDRLMQE